VLRRAFDKAVRRMPPVVAADAVSMQIQLRESAVSRCHWSCAAEHDRRSRPRWVPPHLTDIVRL